MMKIVQVELLMQRFIMGSGTCVGVQWDITPKIKCSDFITCVKRKTVEYGDAAHQYNFDRGPNSNSFAWWVLNECGLDISFLISP